MKPFDDMLPEEKEPQHQELTTFLQRAYRRPVLVPPTEQGQIIARVRERLVGADPADSYHGDLLHPQIGVFEPPQHQTVSPTAQPGPNKRPYSLIALLAAAMIIAVLVGTPLLLEPRLLSTGGDTYDSFVAANGIMFGFDAQHTHFNPFEHTLNPTSVGGLTKQWTYELGSSILSSPTVADGVVYIGCVCGYVYALDAASGAKKWAFWTGGSQVADVPAVVDGVVYIGSLESHTLYALDAATGKKKWSYQTRDSIVSSPTVVGGVVYVGSDDNTLYALDAATGARKWTYRTRGSIESSPAVAGGVVYFGSFDGNVYALDATTGARKWTYRTGNNVYNSLAVAGGVVYVGAGDGNVYALDATTGAKKWTYRIGGLLGPTITSPAVANGIVYVGSRGSVYALDATTGAKKWVSSPQVAISTDPIVAGGLIYFGGGGNVYALDATTSAKKWAYRGGGSTWDCPPVVADGVVYYGSLSGFLYAFHLPGT
ncbi:MAG TPA: PQQ-binding-like beta-propeller repeat protein [Ktedonobacteraceae bacterium]|nr:PQQ-binding-like beta-propeller repeat protein [Ktedonobacteraceae bacterium]